MKPETKRKHLANSLASLVRQSRGSNESGEDHLPAHFPRDNKSTVTSRSGNIRPAVFRQRAPFPVPIPAALIIIGASRATRDIAAADARRWTRKSDRTHLLFSARPKLRRPDYAAYLHRRSTPARKSHIPVGRPIPTPGPRLIRG